MAVAQKHAPRWLVDGVSSVAPNSGALVLQKFSYQRAEIGQFQVELPSLYPYQELWRGLGQLRFGNLGAAAFAADQDYMIAELQLHEDESGGLIRTSADAYARIYDYTASSGYPHLLRVWTYFSAINYGAGDQERYKQFCLGRARGRRDIQGPFPAATVIGRVGSASPWMQVFWLASKNPGIAIDNPRQTKPEHYSRLYGPEAPRFSRGMLSFTQRGTVLFVSGTASVVGEKSQHLGNWQAQFDEAVRNVDAVLQQACRGLKRSSSLGPNTVFRIYVREEERSFEVVGMMRKRFPDSPFCVLAGEVCRAELLLEIEAVHHFD